MRGLSQVIIKLLVALCHVSSKKCEMVSSNFEINTQIIYPTTLHLCMETKNTLNLIYKCDINISSLDFIGVVLGPSRNLDTCPPCGTEESRGDLLLHKCVHNSPFLQFKPVFVSNKLHTTLSKSQRTPVCKLWASLPILLSSIQSLKSWRTLFHHWFSVATIAFYLRLHVHSQWHLNQIITIFWNG